MDLKGIKKHFAKNREEEIFIGRLLDCAERADRGYPVYTKFLTPHERTLAGEVCRFLHIPIVFDGGYEDAERAVAAFLPEYIDNPRTDPGVPVRLLKIALTGRGFSRELTHRDYLGALMSMEMRVLFWQRNSAAEALYTARNG